MHCNHDAEGVADRSRGSERLQPPATLCDRFAIKIIGRLKQLVPPSGGDLKPHDFSDKYRCPRCRGANHDFQAPATLKSLLALGGRARLNREELSGVKK